jgi:probable HAF family extracellular repeat protein
MSAKQFVPIVLALLAMRVAAAPLYTITVPTPASGVAPQGMNNSGQIVGYTSASHAARVDAGGTTDLHPAGATASLAIGINDAGVTAGQVKGSGGVTRATVFSGGTATDIGALGGGASTGSFGWGINAGGQVSGTSYLSGSSGAYHAFLYNPGGAMTDLGALGGASSLGRGLNDAGQVVGEAELAGGNSHAFRLVGGVMQNLGTLGGTFSSAYAINATGVTVGYSQLAGDLFSHAFLSAIGGTMVDLGTLGGDSYAYDINDAGQVVGGSVVGSVTDAFLYMSGVMYNLNALIDPASGWHLTYAAAINESGQIAAEGCRAGRCEALLLDLAATGPVDPTDVPEPASFTAVAAALGLAGIIRRRRPHGRR